MRGKPTLKCLLTSQEAQGLLLISLQCVRQAANLGKRIRAVFDHSGSYPHDLK